MSMMDCIQREKRLNKAIIDNRVERMADLIKAYKEREKQINEIVFVGSGTSNTSSITAYQIVEKFSGISTITILPNLFMNKTVYNKDAMYVFISQTGSSNLTQQAVRKVKALGCLTVAVSEAANTKVAKEADVYVDMGCEVEEYGMRTIGFCSTILTEMMMGLEIGKANGHLTTEAYEGYISEALAMVDHHQYVIDAANQWFDKVKEDLNKSHCFIILGPKSLYGVALEGALKIFEIDKRFTAVGYEMDDGLHGPNMGMKESDSIIVLSDGVSDMNLVTGISKYIKNEVGHAYIIGKGVLDDKDFDFNFVTENFISLEFAPIVQIIAYRLAVDFGIDVPLFKDLYLPDQKYFNTHTEHLGK